MNLTNLFNKYNIINSIPISKGFSSDKKFILTSNQNNKYLLRISDISLLEKKKNQFIVDKPIMFSEIKSTGKSRTEIAEEFRLRVNELGKMDI